MSSLQDQELGTIKRADGRFEARITRDDAAAVWKMLTESSLLPQWLAPGELSQHKGGPAKLDFPESGINVDSVVTAIDPPRLIEYSWSGKGEVERPLRWEIVPAPGGTQLTLSLSIPDSEDVARTCAGWEAHLEMLAAAMEGVPIKFPFERFKTARDAYRALLV
jgi:uncharacterized protein YndB with AHSA1/START domain